MPISWITCLLFNLFTDISRMFYLHKQLQKVSGYAWLVPDGLTH